MTYDLILDKAALRRALALCTKPTALDFETTSLRPIDGRVRLAQLRNDELRCVVDFDQIPGGFAACAGLFLGLGPWVVFNSGFEMRWFLAAGAAPDIIDVGHLRRARMGGGRFSLADMVLWDLEKVLEKTEQVSNWAAPELTDAQLEYAIKDADVTFDLYQHWTGKTTAAHDRAAQLLDDMTLGVIEMEEAGMLLDRRAHRDLVRRWEEIRDELATQVRSLIPEEDVANLNSNPQFSDFFSRIFPDRVLSVWPKTEKTNQLEISGEALAKMAGLFPGTPIETALDALSRYRKIQKYISSFGQTVIDTAARSADGRVRARFNVGAARTCRFSSSGPNLQQVPRDKKLFASDDDQTRVRKSFIAPPGSLLVSYDYSAIEMRVLALLSGDDQLLHDVVFGDVHSEVAAVIAGHKIDKKTPEGKTARSAAKGVSFGIIYGSAAGGLSITMRTTLEKAQSYIDFWAARYPRAFAYRFLMQEEAQSTGFLTMNDGGTIYLGKKNADLPKCANYPVQRAALSVMARAITRHKATLDRLRGSGELDRDRTRLLATIHDALIDEALEDQAEIVKQAMAEDMTQAYLDFFPGAPTDNLIEGGVGPNWADLG
jgi:DNA polymerase-1